MQLEVGTFDMESYEAAQQSSRMNIAALFNDTFAAEAEKQRAHEKQQLERKYELERELLVLKYELERELLELKSKLERENLELKSKLERENMDYKAKVDLQFDAIKRQREKESRMVQAPASGNITSGGSMVQAAISNPPSVFAAVDRNTIQKLTDKVSGTKYPLRGLVQYLARSGNDPSVGAHASTLFSLLFSDICPCDEVTFPKMRGCNTPPECYNLIINFKRHCNCGCSGATFRLGKPHEQVGRDNPLYDILVHKDFLEKLVVREKFAASHN